MGFGSGFFSAVPRPLEMVQVRPVGWLIKKRRKESGQRWVCVKTGEQTRKGSVQEADDQGKLVVELTSRCKEGV